MSDEVFVELLAPESVLRDMVNNSNGEVDFELVLPFLGPHKLWGMRNSSSERAARALLEQRPFTAPYEPEVVFQMVENFRQCGFLHMEDFRKAHWGIMQNARSTVVDLTGNGCRFISTYAPPIKVLAALSKRHPGEAQYGTYPDRGGDE